MKCNDQRSNLSDYLLSEFQIGFMILEIQDMHLEDDFIHVFSYRRNLENCLVLLQLFAHVPESACFSN